MTSGTLNNPQVHEVMSRWRNALTRIVELYDQYRLRPYFHGKLFLVLWAMNILCYWWAMGTAFPEITFGERFGYCFKMQFPVGFFAAAFEQCSVYFSVFLVRRAIRARDNRSYLRHLTFDVVIDLVIGVIATAWIIASFGVSSWLVNYVDRALYPDLKPQKKWAAKAPKAQKRKPAQQTKTVQTAPKKVKKILTPEERRRRRIRREERLAKERSRRIRGTAEELRLKQEYFTYVIQNSLKHPYENWRSFYFGAVLGATELLPSLIHLFFALRALFSLLLIPFRRKAKAA